MSPLVTARKELLFELLSSKMVRHSLERVPQCFQLPTFQIELAGVRTLKDLLFRILNSKKQRVGPILPKQVSVLTFYIPPPVPPTL